MRFTVRLLCHAKAEAGRVRLAPLPIMLGLSLGLHLALMLLHLGTGARPPQQLWQNWLDVVLVNQKSSYAPEQPQALAQANLVGGGDAQDSRRASTPFAFNAAVETGTEATSARQRIAYLELQQRLLLAQVKTELALLDEHIQRAQTPVEPGTMLFERRRLLTQDLGQIERYLERQNQGPRRRFITPSTREAVFADYYDQLRQRIEEVGTARFPSRHGERLYGELVVSLTVQANGQLKSAEVSQSSGDADLDEQAKVIARRAAPFIPFDRRLRSQADELVVISTFRFTQAGHLESTLRANAADPASQP